MAFSHEIIQQIKDRADIVRIVGERVRLAPSGANFKGLCPFHGEKTPSFSVSPQRQFFHCFGCGKGGSVIDFVMALDNLSFGDAAERLAEQLGIALPRGRGEQSGYQQELEVLGAATKYYREQLLDTPAGEVARRYLRGRDFGEETWAEFGLGYAPDAWRNWTEAGTQAGFSVKQLVATGLVKTSASGRHYDLLRNRVVFPIQDDRGRCIGFGGRTLDSAESAKYINTPETRHYKKSRVLYGLSRARDAIRSSGRALLVEGYLDVIRLHERGFHQAVATCGTALTEDHLTLLAHYSPGVTLLFDGDEAGIRAALRSVPLFLNAGVEARVVTLPDALDPNDFLVQRGEEALAKALEQGVPLLEFLVEETLQRQGNGFQAREAALSSLVPQVGQVRRGPARDMALRHLADLANVEIGTILGMLPSAAGSAPPAQHPVPGTHPAGEAHPLDRETRHQRRLLAVLLQERGLLEFVREQIRPDELGDPALCHLFGQLCALPQTQFETLNFEGLTEVFPSQAPLLRDLAMLRLPEKMESREAWKRLLDGEIEAIKRNLSRDCLRRILRAPNYDASIEPAKEWMSLRKENPQWFTRIPRKHPASKAPAPDQGTRSED